MYKRLYDWGVWPRVHAKLWEFTDRDFFMKFGYFSKHNRLHLMGHHCINKAHSLTHSLTATQLRIRQISPNLYFRTPPVVRRERPEIANKTRFNSCTFAITRWRYNKKSRRHAHARLAMSTLDSSARWRSGLPLLFHKTHNS